MEKSIIDSENKHSKQVISKVKWECEKEGGIGTLSWEEDGVKRIVAMFDVGLVMLYKRAAIGIKDANGNQIKV